MTKAVCCLLLALGLAACAPEKAVLVEETQPATGRKPANRTSPGPVGPQEAQAPVVNQQSGMRINTDRLLQLPDRKDMTPTAPVAPSGGGGVIATPPTADKGGE